MLWPTISAVGFCLLTALVIVLARSRTARWERETTSARARRRRGLSGSEVRARRGARRRAGRTPEAARRAAAGRQGVGDPVAEVEQGVGTAGEPSPPLPARRRLRPSAVHPTLGAKTRRLRRPRKDAAPR